MPADLADKRPMLPIFAKKGELMAAVKTSQVIIVIGEIGSGKTTQIPQYLMEAGYGKIAVTQPRRLAAVNAAERVSEQRGCPLGTKVGFTIRFEDRTSGQTVIRYVTDGALLAELLRDKDLSKFSCVVIDQANERSVYTDVLCGILAGLLKRRPELKLIVSTSSDAAKFASYFHAPVFAISERAEEPGIVPIVPQIQRSNLTSVAMMLKAYGITNLLSFPYMDAPPREALVDAITDLYVLGALDREGNLNELGRKMSQLQLEPPLAKLLITSTELGCSEEVLTIVSMLSTHCDSVFVHSAADAQDCHEGNLCTLLDVYNRWKEAKYSKEWCKQIFVRHELVVSAKNIREKLFEALSHLGLQVISCDGDFAVLQRVICAGLFVNAAVFHPITASYSIVFKRESAVLQPISDLLEKPPQLIVCSDVLEGEPKILRNITVAKTQWLAEHVAALIDRIRSDISTAEIAEKENEAVKPVASTLVDLESRLLDIMTQCPVAETQVALD